MDEYQQTPNLPADTPKPWLARNRKIVILGGLVLILGAATAVIAWRSTPKSPNNSTGNQVNSTTNSANTNTGRPTFQRSIVTNTSSTLPPAYRPPTTEELRQAISNLNTNSTTNP